MNSEGAKKWWKEIEALKNGETIEYRMLGSHGYSLWQECKSPEFSCHPKIEYRIKPKLIEVWVIFRQYCQERGNSLPFPVYVVQDEVLAKAECIHLNAKQNVAKYTYHRVEVERAV